MVRPATAPAEISVAKPARPTERNASASAASLLMSVYLTMPVMTMQTSTYSTVQIASEPMMPRGRSRCGFFASSAVVATTSNPMNAKNTSDAPDTRPITPNVDGVNPNSAWNSGVVMVTSPFAAGTLGGMNGDRFEPLT